MSPNDEVAVWFASAVLRGSDYEIEALSLEAMAADSPSEDLNQQLEKARLSEQRGGALGLEIVGAILVPVMVEAARQFWEVYKKELIEKIGKSAVSFTLDELKAWFFRKAEPQDKLVLSTKLANTIRQIGTDRKLNPADIDALVAATDPEKLEKNLSNT